MLSVEKLVNDNFPNLGSDSIKSRMVKGILRFFIDEKAFQQFAEDYPHLKRFDFIEQVFEHLNFSYSVHANEVERIPKTGRVVIIANHPIGSLDGLALLQLVGGIRRDVKAMANQLLTNIEPLQSLLLPVNNLSGSSAKSQLKAIKEHLNNEGAVIIFPSGEVSRANPTGVKDPKWRSGFLRLAKETQSAIIPIHIDGRNSPLFYGASMLYKPLSTLMLVKEMFRQQSRTLRLRIGEPIPFASYNGLKLNPNAQIKLFKRHLYKLGKNRSGIFQTETAIAHPVDRQQLTAALAQCEKLGATPDNKQILLFKGELSSPVMQEVARLREIAFRAVGEGTGKKRDYDIYDQYYEHLILWDPQELEIAGAYRLADTATVIANQGIEGLYSATLFDFEESMQPYLQQGLELGRSFVQPRYWGKRSLEYLWYGIGAYLCRYPRFRYLFGPVSISNEMPPLAKDMMISFYQRYFPGEQLLARSKRPYQFAEQQDLSTLFCGDNYQQDFKTLKYLLSNMGCSIPTLYKQYTELTEPGGVFFLDFNVDPQFNACVDGLVMVDITQLKPQKQLRYIGHERLSQTDQP